MAMSAFGRAFRDARAAGEKTFEFPKGSGKMYNTQLAQPKKKKLPDDIDAQLNTAREDAAAKKRATQDLEVKPPTSKDMPMSSFPSGSIMGKGAKARGEYTRMKPSLEEQQDAAIAKQKRIQEQDKESPLASLAKRAFNAIREAGNKTLPESQRSPLMNARGGMIKKKAASKPAAKKMGGGSMKYSKGGSAGRGDGLAQRGKTRGRMC